VDCGRRAPLRRSETEDSCLIGVDHRPGTSLGIRGSSEFCCTQPAGVLVPGTGFTLGCFQLRLAGVSLDAVPRFTCAKRVHPPTSFTSLQSSPVPRPLHTSRCEAPPLGFAFPLRGVSRQNPCPGVSMPPNLSVRGVSHTFDGFRPYRPCGFISPHNHVQGSPYRGLLLSHSRNASSTSRALTSVSQSSLLAVAHKLHVPWPRPQGFDPCESPCSICRGLADLLTRSPLGLLLLQVFSLNAV